MYSPLLSDLTYKHVFDFGAIGPHKTHFVQNSCVPFTVLDDKQWSDKMKGIPEFGKIWVLGYMGIKMHRSMLLVETTALMGQPLMIWGGGAEETEKNKFWRPFSRKKIGDAISRKE